MAPLKLITLTVAMSFFVSSVSASFPKIAGNELHTDVSAHAKIDVDQKQMEAFLMEYPPNFALAKEIYSEGKNSPKSSGMRTLQGFSKNDGKMAMEKTFFAYQRYWKNQAYANDLVVAALDGTGMYTDIPSEFRVEAAQKTSAYQNIWMYAIWEMQDAINDCNANDLKLNDDPNVKAWDEFWAFYAGSLEGAEVGGNPLGASLYRLAQKRCENFGTCTADVDGDWTTGVAMVNHRVMQHHIDGHMMLTQKAGTAGCEATENIKEAIVAQMTVPLVQGTLRYLYKQATAPSPKQGGELWAFAAAILPRVHQCNSATAAMLNASSYPGTQITDFRRVIDVKEALEATYACLGIKCSDVGGLLKNKLPGEVEYFPGMKPCDDTVVAAASNTPSGANPAASVSLLAVLATAAGLLASL